MFGGGFICRSLTGLAGSRFLFLGEDVALKIGLPREDDRLQTVKLGKLLLVCSSDKLSNLLETAVMVSNICMWFGELHELQIHVVEVI